MIREWEKNRKRAEKQKKNIYITYHITRIDKEFDYNYDAIRWQQYIRDQLCNHIHTHAYTQIQPYNNKYLKTSDQLNTLIRSKLRRFCHGWEMGYKTKTDTLYVFNVLSFLFLFYLLELISTVGKVSVFFFAFLFISLKFFVSCLKYVHFRWEKQSRKTKEERESGVEDGFYKFIFCCFHKTVSLMKIRLTSHFDVFLFILPI